MSQILIYQTGDNQATVEVQFDGDTVWLNLNQIAMLFGRDKSVISRHFKNVFLEGELDKNSVVAKNATTAADDKIYQVEFYNLDAIISVGYRVNSKRGTQFRIWATQQLKSYLLDGYVINEKRLAQKEMKVQYLKSGIQILSRAIAEHIDKLADAEDLAKMLEDFAEGLSLLDDYDHEALDQKGNSRRPAVEIPIVAYHKIVEVMRADFASDVFGKEKDGGFQSAIRQVYQSFDGQDLYATLEEKAAMLLYLIVKNHAFVDGNKRIAAACFLLFLEKNNLLYRADGQPILSNDALATLTLFIAASRPEEMKTAKYLTISILNRNKK
jgi:prophage maintenance system killer protein